MSDNREFEESMHKAIEQIIDDIATRNMKRACIIIETEAKKKCPVDMGHLRASITNEVEVTESEIVGLVGSNMEYAPYVHNGTGIYATNGDGRKTPWGYKALAGKYKGFHWTRGQRPQPFLEDAKLSQKSRVEQILGGK